MEEVILCSSEEYKKEELVLKIYEIFKKTGFFQRTQKDERIFLKVNLLSAATAEKSVCTHPVFVDSVIDVLHKNGYKNLKCGDSPGIGSPEKVAKVSGILDVLQKNSVEFVSIIEDKSVKTLNSHRRKYINLFKEIDDFDTILNLPKLKTHCLMTMTLGVKNLYGLLPGKANKVDGHMKENTTEKFALYLMDIFETVSSKVKLFTLVDGVVGMEGDGPGNGMPVKTSIVAGSFDTRTLDYFLVRWCGLSLEEYPLFVVASDKFRIRETTSMLMDRYGTFYREIKRPKKGDISFNVPVSLKRVYKRFFFTYLNINTGKCKRCGICRKSCPADAIEIKRDGYFIKEKRCIRCFCCHEMCPHDAVEIKSSLPLRILKRITDLIQNTLGV